MELQPDGSLREIPPGACPHCGSTELRPGWGECPLTTCRAMGRTYECPQRHVTVAPWHAHRALPSERPRWHCGYETD